MASTSTSLNLSRSFPLPSDILAPGSATSIDLGLTSDAAVLMAVAANNALPDRPIEIGRVAVTASGGADLALNAGQTKVGFQFTAGVQAGVGIFDDPAAALAALALGEAPGLDLRFEDTADSRFALLRTGYQAAGEVKGSHPIGAVGSFSFGVKGAAKGLLAVLHRFEKTKGGQDVFRDTFAGWRLPRQVDDAGKLAPQTWIIAEADGTLAVKLAAKLGYDFSFVREARLGGLSGDVGLKLDAAAMASFGFEVAGRYLVVVGRESPSASDTRLRLRLFKLSRNGINFGLDLKFGVTGVAGLLPNKADDFVKAVFGVHGVQVVKALQQIERWTDPDKSVGELVAGLANERALQLLKDVTGVDPRAAFEQARGRLVGLIDKWNSLPDRASSELWGILDTLDDKTTVEFRDVLTLLASDDRDEQRKAFQEILAATNFAATPAGRLLIAAGERGLLALLDRLDHVRTVARTVQAILDGDMLRRLKSQLEQALKLDKIFDVVKKTDFDKLDSFLVGRLAHFFDRQLKFEDLEEIKDTINLVVKKRGEIYEKARKALTSRHGFELSATWAKTTARTALLDAVFDTSDAQARTLLQAVLKEGDYDSLLTTSASGVALNSAVLTHEIAKKSTLEISLPHFNFQTESANRSLARVSVEEDGGRLLLYDADAVDEVKVRNKYRSSLAMTCSAAIAAGGAAFPNLRVHSRASATWSYQLLHAKENMKREELEYYTRPFILRYMPESFAGATNLSAWYSQFDRTVENILSNGPEEFGDVLASFEVTVPGEAVSAWILPRTELQAKALAKEMSLAIQRALKETLSFYYFQDAKRLALNPSSAALLAWSSLPAATSARVSGDRLVLSEGDSVYWNHPDVSLRRSMVLSARTRENLLASFGDIRRRLEEAGLHGQAADFGADRVRAFQQASLTSDGDTFLGSLCVFESRIVNKAAESLRDVADFMKTAGTAPTKAIASLAEFAADITTAFNKLSGETVFGKASLRSLGSLIFLEASRVLSPDLAARPKAMLNITVLNEQRKFRLGDFLAGEIPPAEDVAMAQRLVSIA